jgi:hypothetical protein
MRAITTIGLDIAKSVFQVHGIDAEGNVVVRRQPAPIGSNLSPTTESGSPSPIKPF